jgi:phosphoglycolate phosphatase-like HAD superfamily hydrolase
MKRLAVFDWNGTLFDDLDANLKGANAVFEILGRTPLTAAQYQQTFTFPILHFYTANNIPADEYLKRHDEAAKVFLETYEKAAEEHGLRPMALEFLQWLNDNEVDCMLLSNHLKENVGRQLARFHIRHLFSHISCNDIYDAAFIQRMNKRDRLQTAMEENGYSPEHAFIIGDSLEEPEIAGLLGLTSFSITGGSLNRERLLSSGTDYVIDHFSELFPIVGKMWELEYKKAS